MTEDEFVQFCKQQGLDADSALDEMVHEMVSLDVSAINNSGIEGQLEYLQGSCKMKDDDIKKVLSAEEST